MFHRGKIILIYQYMKWIIICQHQKFVKLPTEQSTHPHLYQNQNILHFVPKRWNEPGADTELEKIFKNSDAVE